MAPGSTVTNAEQKRTPVEHPTAAERAARGKAARSAVPRERIAEFEPVADRADPIDLLEEQAATRVPELVPIRYGRMLVSPFAFYRGAALIMAADLAPAPVSGLKVQACGDAHMANFGVFASPERNLVFDVNDFDETLPGPWEWDIKRLAASLAVAGRDRGFTTKERIAVVEATAAGYRTELQELAGMRELDVWYRRFDIDAVMAAAKALSRPTRDRTTAAIAKARTRDSLQAFSKLTHMVDGEPRIVSDPPLIVPLEEVLSADELEVANQRLHNLLRAYRHSLQTDRRHLLEQFRLVHVARKVVGVGSVGTRAWIVLLLGRDDADPLFLQVKEAQPSVLSRFLGKSGFANQGERVVAGQRMMQSVSDILLGWERIDAFDGQPRDFYFRQLRDGKGSVDPDQMVPEGQVSYGRLCGQALALAHARSGDRIAISSYLGKSAAFDHALAAFAETYADQNQRDYDALRAAVDSGRVTAEVGL
ncbi:MAG TPA: DUF2252 domain-containing protein [Acidimicrobiales bacterium]